MPKVKKTNKQRHTVSQECNLKDEAGKSYELSLIGYKCIETYVRHKRNQNEICWIRQKVRSEDDRGFQHFLDTVQYKSNGILRYKRVFGPGFVSTGGIDKSVLQDVQLDDQKRVKQFDSQRRARMEVYLESWNNGGVLRIYHSRKFGAS